MTLSINGISIPDSALARDVTQLVRDTESSLLFHHSSRVYYFGALAGKHRGLRFDPELQRVYRRLKFNKGAGVAKVAIARKLAVKLYWLLRATASCAQMAPMQGSSRGTLVPNVGSIF